VQSTPPIQIIFAPEVSDDFDRIIAHLNQHNAGDIEERIADILSAIDVLERNPQIGRPTADGLSELIVGRDARGYVVLYTYAAGRNTVFILAVRSQREVGYAQRGH
jgi:toxin ParE1/3/4